MVDVILRVFLLSLYDIHGFRMCNLYRWTLYISGSDRALLRVISEYRITGTTKLIGDHPLFIPNVQLEEVPSRRGSDFML